MSIIMGAIAGAGEAGEKYFQQEQRTENEVKMAGVRSDLDLQRTKLIAKNVMDNQDIQRKQEADDVGKAKAGIIQKAVDEKYATAKPADPSTWTPEMEAAVQQSKGIYSDSLQDDPTVVRKAGAKTGYLTTKEDLTSSQNAELGQAKMDAAMQIHQGKMENLLARSEDKNATMLELGKIRAESTMANAQLRVDAANQRATSGKIDTATGRMLITSEDANIKASSSQLSMLNRQLENIRPEKNGKPNSEYQDIKAQMDGIKGDITTSQANKNSYLKTMGLMKDAPEPAARPTAALAAPSKPGKVLNFDPATGGFK